MVTSPRSLPVLAPSAPYSEEYGSGFAEEPGASLGDYLTIIARRWKAIVATGTVIFALALAVALLLPPTYRSSATILIQEQQIPSDLVRSTITSYADERIQVISQEVLSRSVLLGLIEKYNLYAKKRRYVPTEDVVDEMRKDIKVLPISADVRDPRSGSQVKATIAFKISFDGSAPDLTQKVANELVSLFLNENVKNREERAAETSEFLEAEANRLSQHIADTESKLADFKAKNADALPEEKGLNLQISDRNSADLIRIQHDITEATDRRMALESELALTPRYNALPTDGGAHSVLPPDEQLKSLKNQLLVLQGTYTADHPDVIRVKRQIAALEAQGYGAGDDDHQRQLAAAERDYQELRERYSADYPDVVRAKRTLDTLRAQSTTATARAADPTREAADNPVYLNLRAEIDAANAQLLALNNERTTLQERQRDFDARLARSPDVERDYLALTRDLDESRLSFHQIKEKEMEAQVAQQLEDDRKAERFTLIEPPQYPERPASPNRLALGLVGFVLACLGGLGGGAVKEKLDDTVKTSADLVRRLNVPNLVTIPTLATETLSVARSRAQKRRRRLALAWALAIMALLGLAAIGIHVLVVPLDVAWFSLLRRVGM